MQTSVQRHRAILPYDIAVQAPPNLDFLLGRITWVAASPRLPATAQEPVDASGKSSASTRLLPIPLRADPKSPESVGCMGDQHVHDEIANHRDGSVQNAVVEGLGAGQPGATSHWLRGGRSSGSRKSALALGGRAPESANLFLLQAKRRSLCVTDCRLARQPPPPVGDRAVTHAEGDRGSRVDDPPSFALLSLAHRQ